MYDVRSPRAEEFIDHAEVMATVQYAREHARDAALLDEILARAA